MFSENQYLHYIDFGKYVQIMVLINQVSSIY